MPSSSPSPIASRFSGALARIAATAALAALLANCGGGGGGGDHSGPDPFDIGLPDADTLAQQCANPRPGDKQGSLETEKAWLRSWIDETYLWFQDVRGLPAATLDPANSATPLDYFAKLKSPATTASGKDKDRFHFTYPTDEWIALSQSGVSYGYGFQAALVDDSAPDRVAIVAYVEPGTPATVNGIARGTEILSVDGVAVSDGDATVINAALFPKSAGGQHTFVVRDAGASTTRSVTMTAQAITSTPVLKVATLPAPNQNVGYLLFNDHIATSEAQLVSAINTLKAAAVTDLVLDVRYNGGGYLDIAAELAYMIAGPTYTNGKFFERLNYNERDPFHQSLADRTTYFFDFTQGFSGPSGQPLPTLDLGRVFVLVSADTCSASEAIVNGLRGAGVTVNLVGGTTCGKPYGFYPQDNCGTTYFAIQFQGVNFLGFGDYADGFAPTCSVADDFSHELGDPAEHQLEVALGLRNAGACTAPTSVRAGPSGIGRKVDAAPVLTRTPERENRIYRPK